MKYSELQFQEEIVDHFAAEIHPTLAKSVGIFYSLEAKNGVVLLTMRVRHIKGSTHCLESPTGLDFQVSSLPTKGNTLAYFRKILRSQPLFPSYTAKTFKYFFIRLRSR